MHFNAVPEWLTLVVIALVIVVIAATARKSWRIPAPDEALIVTGLGVRSSSPKFQSVKGMKVVVGKPVIAPPVFTAVRKINLNLAPARLDVECVTQQGIPVHVRGIVLFKVGDDEESIVNAARRFLGRQQDTPKTVHDVFTGHLRAIVGQITLERLITDREELAKLTRINSSSEMEKLGLVVDSLQIQEIVDPTNYIEDVRRPFHAKIDREASEREAEAAVLKARATQESRVAEENAKKNVLEQEIRVAELAAHLKEQELQATVRKPAEAEAAAAEQRADAMAYERRVLGEANAEAIRIKGIAEADVIRAKGEALASNQDAVVAERLAEQWPAIVDASAKAISQAEHLMIFNGAEGLTQFVTTLATEGATGLRVLRDVLSSGARSASSNGKAPSALPVENSQQSPTGASRPDAAEA